MREAIAGLDLARVSTPAYIVDLGRLRHNLGILADVQQRAGCKILLALKGFAMWGVFPVVREYLAGVACSSPSEARLGRELFAGEPGDREVHAYAPAYSEADIAELSGLVDHLVFNSVGQVRRLGPVLRARNPDIDIGLRLNPEHSEVATAIYDPCARFSRLGVSQAAFDPSLVPGIGGEAGSGSGSGDDIYIDGLHFHTLCELGSDALERTVEVVEQKFGAYLERVKWVNFGGGHYITRADYDIDRLLRIIEHVQRRYDVDVYLEPGEAICLDAGVLVTQVLDLIDNGMPVAVLDTSATAHMPDVMEMPYRPVIRGADEPEVLPHTYRLGGLTCLAGDVIGDYSFADELDIGSKLTFMDMAQYTMVKNTMFNGVRLPDIATYEPDTGELTVLRRFGYEDYKSRLS